MRSLTTGEGWLRANMVLMVWVGIPLNLGVLMAKVCGDSFTKAGEDFLIVFPLKLVLVLLFFSRMIVGVRRVL